MSCISELVKRAVTYLISRTCKVRVHITGDGRCRLCSNKSEKEEGKVREREEEKREGGRVGVEAGGVDGGKEYRGRVSYIREVHYFD